MMRGLLVASLGLLMMGPATGHTGGCSDDGSEQPADFFQYCQDSRGFECLRGEARGEVMDVQACVDDAADRCDDIGGWPFDCQPLPTRRETDACIAELARTDNLGQRLADLPECDLCP